MAPTIYEQLSPELQVLVWQQAATVDDNRVVFANNLAHWLREGRRPEPPAAFPGFMQVDSWSRSLTLPPQASSDWQVIEYRNYAASADHLQLYRFALNQRNDVIVAHVLPERPAFSFLIWDLDLRYGDKCNTWRPEAFSDDTNFPDLYIRDIQRLGIPSNGVHSGPWWYEQEMFNRMSSLRELIIIESEHLRISYDVTGLGHDDLLPEDYNLDFHGQYPDIHATKREQTSLEVFQSFPRDLEDSFWRYVSAGDRAINNDNPLPDGYDGPIRWQGEHSSRQITLRLMRFNAERTHLEQCTWTDASGQTVPAIVEMTVRIAAPLAPVD